MSENAQEKKPGLEKEPILEKTGISRRTFLAGATSAAALAVVGTLPAACAPRVVSEEKVEPSTASSEENSIWKIEELGDPKETITADVCIVGGGGAGTAAGIQAMQLGLKPVVLEKKNALGGSFIGVEGLFAIGSHWQKEKGLDYTIDEFLLDVLEFHHYIPNINLLRTYFEKTASTIDWLEELGVEFDFVQSQAGSRISWHIPTGSPKPGVQFVKSLTDAAQKMGLPTEFATSGKRLLLDADGKIEGVLAVRSDGTVVKVQAPAVIISTGGYANNMDMLEYLVDARRDTIMVMGMDGRDGDGIKMGHAVGAALAAAPGTTGPMGPSAKSVPFSSLAFAALNEPIALWINQDGDRFLREDMNAKNFAYIGHTAKHQKRMYILFSAAQVDQLENGTGAMTGNGVFMTPGTKMTGLSDEIQKLMDSGVAKKADTVAELAQAIEIDPVALAATIDQYNQMVDNGADEVLLKDAKYLSSFAAGPYYAFDCLNSFFFTTGGLKVNPKAQVVDNENVPVPGLYATGCDAGGLYGDTYDYFITPGSQGAWAINSGRMAAEDAADYLKK